MGMSIRRERKEESRNKRTMKKECKKKLNTDLFNAKVALQQQEMRVICHINHFVFVQADFHLLCGMIKVNAPCNCARAWTRSGTAALLIRSFESGDVAIEFSNILESTKQVSWYN